MPPLQHGDIVEIILPASGCNRQEYDAAIGFVREFGLEPRFRPYEEVIVAGLCANNVAYRFQHLMAALQSDAKAVWCLKGGYGSQKLLGLLDEVATKPQEKLFIGFSDITILLNYFADKWGWTCLHGPMPGQVGSIANSSWENLADIIFGRKNGLSFHAKPLNQAAKSQKITGRLVGGCLSLMQALIGTGHMPNLEDAILLLEDDKFETPRRIDRIFDHMQRAGIFYDVKAVLLGNFLENSASGAEEVEVNEVIASLANYLDERGIALLQNKQIGHCHEIITVPIGGRVELELVVPASSQELLI